MIAQALLFAAQSLNYIVLASKLGLVSASSLEHDLQNNSKQARASARTCNQNFK